MQLWPNFHISNDCFFILVAAFINKQAFCVLMATARNHEYEDGAVKDSSDRVSYEKLEKPGCDHFIIRMYRLIQWSIFLRRVFILQAAIQFYALIRCNLAGYVHGKALNA